MQQTIQADRVLVCEKLSCPMPVIRTKKTLEEMEPGQVLEVRATDKGSVADLPTWAKRAGHQYIGVKEENGVYRHFLRKASVHEINEETGFVRKISNEQLSEKLAAGENLVVIDVREPAEFAFGHVPGAISIPLGELERRLDELKPDQPYAVICRTGNRSDLACKIMSERGFTQLWNVVPGMSRWHGEVESDL